MVDFSLVATAWPQQIVFHMAVASGIGEGDLVAWWSFVKWRRSLNILSSFFSWLSKCSFFLKKGVRPYNSGQTKHLEQNFNLGTVPNLKESTYHPTYFFVKSHPHNCWMQVLFSFLIFFFLSISCLLSIAPTHFICLSFVFFTH